VKLIEAPGVMEVAVNKRNVHDKFTNFALICRTIEEIAIYEINHTNGWHGKKNAAAYPYYTKTTY
jgi:hypothetical protein